MFFADGSVTLAQLRGTTKITATSWLTPHAWPYSAAWVALRGTDVENEDMLACLTDRQPSHSSTT